MKFSRELFRLMLILLLLSQEWNIFRMPIGADMYLLVICMFLAKAWRHLSTSVALRLLSIISRELVSQLIRRYLREMCWLQLIVTGFSGFWAASSIFFFYNTDKQKEATLTKYSHICYYQTCTLLKLALYYTLPLCQIQNWWWYLPKENFLDVLSWCIWPLKDVVVYNEIFQSKKWRWL